MSDATTPATNIERLKKNLSDGSLAIRLVAAYESSDGEKRSEALKALLQNRLDQVRSALESPKA